MNEKKIPCETVRDLFPSYIDGLTSDVTNGLIEEHIADCTACGDILKAMRMPEPALSDTKKGEGKVLDFLKKNKRRNMKILIGSVAGAIVLALALVYLRLFVVGGEMGGDWIACEVTVNGSQVVLDGTPMDSALCISNVTFTEENGVVTAHTKAVLASWFRHNGSFHATYTANTNEVRQVCINDRILWNDGYQITSLASEVYQTRHAYMGSMSANARTANALNVAGYLGSYTNELRTSQSPYTWVIRLSEDIPAEEQLTRESYMNALAYVMMGVIENLEQVTYEYTVDGQSLTRDVTVEDGRYFFDGDIKQCAENVSTLDRLISEARLSISPTYRVTQEKSDGHDNLNVTVIVDTDQHIKSYTHTLLKDGKVYNESVDSAEPYLGIENKTRFGFSRPDNSDKDLTGSQLEMAFSVKTPDGKAYPVQNKVKIPAVYGSNTVIKLKGSAEKGFTAEVINTYYFISDR